MKDYGPNPSIFQKWLRNYKVARHRPKIWRLPNPDIGYIKITKVASTSVELTLARHLHKAQTGGDMDEMRLWPLGGLSEPHGRGFLQDHVHTMMGGPVVNLLLALTCIITISLALISPFNARCALRNLDAGIFAIPVLFFWISAIAG